MEEAQAWARLREGGSWLLDELMTIAELKARLGIRELPDEIKGRYNTLSGFLMTESGRLPDLGEKVYCEGWIFEVMDLNVKRIDKVLALQDPLQLNYFAIVTSCFFLLLCGYCL